MKNSLFEKKEITKKEAGKVLGGKASEYEQPSIGERHTGSWNIIFGYISDTEPYTDSTTMTDSW